MTLRILLALALLAGCSGSKETDGDRPPTNNGVAPDGTPYERPVDYVRSTAATKLVFELDTIEGVDPRPEALDYVVDRLRGRISKPDGIEWRPDATIASRGADHVWTFEELQELADEQADLSVEPGEISIHVLYLDGAYEDESVLGVAWSNRHLAMFSGTLESSCDQLLVGDSVCEAAESSVLLHEVGHVLGLVDNGLEMVEDHADPEHGAHDESEDCVMYWAYEGVGILDALTGPLTGSGGELDFGDDCVADLAAAQ